MKGEKCYGTKLSKVQLIVLLCLNADRTEKLTPFMIGKSKKPQCFKNIKFADRLQCQPEGLDDSIKRLQWAKEHINRTDDQCHYTE